MSIDLIVVQPQDFRYPLFEKFVHENKFRFHRVVIVWSNMNTGLDVRKEVEEKMAKDDIAFMQAPQHTGDQDWRNVAINHALKYSMSEWIWFTEQDFFPKEGFWKEVSQLQYEASVFGAFDHGRLHPSCLFIKRNVLNKTNLDFSADPEAHWDHFGKIQLDLAKNVEPMYAIDPKLYYHMNGLTHNLHLKHDKKKVTYKPKEFKEYLKRIKWL